MTKTILVTGGLGYVGGRISRFLSENSNNELIIADIEKRAAPPIWLKKGKIVNLDLSSGDLDDVCKGVDCIIHLAATNEIESGSNPEKALLINGLGSLKLLRSAEKNKVKRLIYFSTAHIYKNPLSGSIDENTLTRPGHPYAITHKVAEDFILASHDRKSIEGVVLRMSNSFGAPVNPEVNRWTLLVNDLCRQAVADKKLVLKSAGLQERDFITLEDVCRAVSHFIELPSDRICNGIFNLGGERSLSIIDMTRLIADRCKTVLGFYPEIVKPEPDGNEKVDHLTYRIDKIKTTGFDLLSNFDKEIDNMLKFCDEHFSK